MTDSPRLSAEYWEFEVRRRAREVETARVKLRLAVLVLADVLNSRPEDRDAPRS